MKRVLSVQDLSCLGRCSLTAALPVLSAMGCECSVLPTAVLSTHTAFPKPHIHSLTEDIAAIVSHWQHIGVRFDAIAIGYLSDPAQAEAVAHLIDCFGSLVVLDPAMGDHGTLYSGITPEHVRAMEHLCRKSQILLPNVTEAALLTGLPYREEQDPYYLQELTAGLLDLGADAVILTGVSLQPDTTGFFSQRANAAPFLYQTEKLSKRFHGTGDLFSAVFTGGIVAEKKLSDAARLAAGFVERCIAATEEVTPYGVEFEAQLPWLWQQLQRTPQAACTNLCPGF